MIPRRLHSARRNKRWQVVTWCGALFIISIWALSEIWFFVIYVPLGAESLTMGSLSSTFGMGHSVFSSNGIEVISSSASSTYRNPDISRIVPKIIDGSVVVIPYWMILTAFLTVQYLLLPKSLPVTEEK